MKRPSSLDVDRAREGMAEGTREHGGHPQVTGSRDLHGARRLQGRKDLRSRCVGIGSHLKQQFSRPHEVNEEKRDRGRLGHRRNGSRESTR